MKWKKLGQIFNPVRYQTNWMKEFGQCTSTLVFDNFVRIYFSCRPERDEQKQAVSYTTFIDVDRKDLTKIINVAKNPILPLGKIGCFDEHAVYPTSVIRHGGDVLLYYAGWYRTKSVPFNTSIGVAVSKDEGVTFNRLGDGPILGPTINEPFVISGPKIRRFNNKWFLYYLAGTKWIYNDDNPEIVYKIKMATSEDGIVWNKLDKNIITDLLEENECQAGPDVFLYEGRYLMYFAYRYALNFRSDKQRGYRIGFATSTDLTNWIREDENAGISYSESGWDSEMLHYPHVFELDGHHYMLYNGNEFGRWGFGLAVLEK